MNKIVVSTLLVVACCTAANSIQGASFYIAGDIGTLSPGIGGGVLEIIYEPASSGYGFENGGVGLQLNSSAPGVIRFTSAEVILDGRWTAGSVLYISDNEVDVDAFSILTPGLPTDSPSVFATVTFEVIGSDSTDLSLSPRGFYWFPGPIDLVGAAITVVPEPGSINLVTGLIATTVLTYRRRRVADTTSVG